MGQQRPYREYCPLEEIGVTKGLESVVLRVWVCHSKGHVITSQWNDFKKTADAQEVGPGVESGLRD